MRRRFNYTGRRRISQKLIVIDVVKSGDVYQCNASWDFADLRLPLDAAVYLEARIGGSPQVTRYDWGTVRESKPPQDRTIPDFGTQSLSFDLKVVDETEEIGRLVAVSRGIRPRLADDEGGRMPLLPVNADDLGDEVWRLRFTDERPWLEVNNRIDGIKEISRSDQRFFALVYPHVIRRILMEGVLLDGVTDPAEAEDDWRVSWLKWGIHWHPDNERPPDSKDRDGVLQWIEDVAVNFCSRHEARQKFIDALGTG